MRNTEHLNYLRGTGSCTLDPYVYPMKRPTNKTPSSSPPGADLVRVTFDTEGNKVITPSSGGPAGAGPDIFRYLSRLSSSVPRLGGIYRMECDPEGQEQSRYHETYHEMVVVLDGSRTYEINGERLEVERNDVLLIKPRDVHRYLPGASLEAVALHFSFAHLGKAGVLDTAGHADPFLDFLANHYPRLHRIRLVESAHIRETIAHLLKHHRQPGAGSHLLLSLHLIEILVCVARNFLFGRADNSVRGEKISKRDELMVREIIAYLDTHFAEDIDPASVYRGFFLHPNYCRNIFKSVTGRSVTSWLLNRRLNEARRLLAETDRTVSQIAVDVGFNDYSYFQRAFKKEYGSPPGAIRKTGGS